jgi:hypothetical protein
VWSAAIVEVQPACQGGVAFGAGAVDRAVGPAAEQCADEALGLAVGLRSVGPGSDVPNPERSASDRVHRRPVCRPVVGHQPLDGYAVAGVVLDGAAQEADRGEGLLVREDFDVGQAGGVVDGDVHVVPADDVAIAPIGQLVRASWVALDAGDPLARAVLDASELLDVDVDQLTGASSFVALPRLEAEPAELAHPDSGQDPRDGRARHAEALGDFGAGHSEPAQRGNHLDASLLGAVGDGRGRRAAVLQPDRALAQEPVAPLAARAVAHSGGRGRLRDRPPLLGHPTDHQLAALRAERRVSVNLHPVSSLGLIAWQLSASKGHRMALPHRQNNVVRIYT